MRNGRLGAQGVDAADHVVDRAEAEFRHGEPEFFGDHEQVVDDVLGRTGELAPQIRILGGDAHRAGVQVALAHHDAAQGDQRRGGEAELLGAEQRGDGDVASGFELAVGLQHYAGAQVVHHQGLMGFGDAEFPWHPGVLDGRERRRAGTAGVAGDDEVIGARLDHAGGDRADADGGAKFDADARLGIAVLQVVDQLRDVLDGVDVVVRWRADQAHPRGRVTNGGDVVVYFAAGQFAPLAGLSRLGRS